LRKFFNKKKQNEDGSRTHNKICGAAAPPPSSLPIIGVASCGSITTLTVHNLNCSRAGISGSRSVVSIQRRDTASDHLTGLSVGITLCIY